MSTSHISLKCNHTCPMIITYIMKMSQKLLIFRENPRTEKNKKCTIHQ